MEKRRLKIGVGKFGKSFKFKQASWGLMGGDHEFSYFLALAQLFPNVDFYIMSRNDLGKTDPAWRAKYIPSNMHNIWDTYDKSICEIYKYPYEYFKKEEITLDFAFILSGPTPNCSIPEYAYSITVPDKLLTPMMMGQNYAGPIIYMFNQTKTPYVEFGEDPRYFPSRGQDLIHRCVKILSTRDIPADSEENKKVHTTKHITEILGWERKLNNNDIVKSTVLESFLTNEDYSKVLKEPGERKELISIYSNGLTTNGGIHKFPILDDYIFKQFKEKEYMIYGKWDPDEIYDKSYSESFNETAMIDLIDDMYSTKYTLMIAIKSNWPSSKIYKMLYFGIIPFCYENWDTDLTVKLPAYLRVKSAEEFKEKITELDNNPDMYNALWKSCQELLKPEYFNGDHFLNSFVRLIAENVPDFMDCDFTTGEIKTKLTCLFKPEGVQKKVKAKKLF